MSLVPLHNLVAEAQQLGAGFRLSGTLLVVDKPGAIPAPLKKKLRGRRDELCAMLASKSAQLLAATGVTVKVATTAAQADFLVSAVLDDAGAGPIGIDIETAPKPELNPTRTGAVKVSNRKLGLSPHSAEARLIQAYGGGGICAVFNMRDISWGALEPLWGREIVAHNAKFELLFLRGQGVHPASFQCTMQAAGLMLGVHRRSLVEAASAYLDWSIPKDLQTSNWGAAELSPDQYAYAALDAVAALLLWRRLQPDLVTKDRWAAYVLQRDAIPGAVEMEWRGMGVGQIALRNEIDKWSRELSAARRAWVKETGEAPPGTAAEIRDWLGLTLSEDELATWPRTEKTSKLSVAAETFDRAAHNPAIRPLLQMRAKESLLNKFGASLLAAITPSTGRIHAHFNVAATKSGRWSCERPNLQAIPNSHSAPGFRQIFCADDGRVLVGGDYSQMELRVAAEVSQDGALRKIYEDGLDLHKIQAASMARVPVDEVTDGLRNRAKPVNFGSIYGMGSKALVEMAWKNYRVVMTLPEAQGALEKFFAKFHTLKRWMRQHADTCNSRHRIDIGAGRVLQAGWEPGGLRYTQCCNLPIQGASADIMMLAIAKVHRGLQAENIEGGLVASVHDELILEVRESQAPQAKSILEAAMLEAFTQTCPRAPVSGLVSVTVGTTWGDLK
jgi:DNA polymerase-1